MVHPVAGRPASASEAIVPGRPPGRLEGLRLALRRIGLPAWFIVIDLLWIARTEVLGIDARHYQRAASTWLAGGDPWSVTEAGIPYASGPHTLLFYAPTSVLPVPVSTALWTGIGLAASVWVVRRLRLPWWWIAFPPLAHAIWNGNPQTLVVALLVEGGALAATVAVGLKLYAVLPLLWRPRNLLVAAVAMLVLLPVVPWTTYLSVQAGVASHLETAWDGSAWRVPVLVVPTIAALWVLRRRGGEWLSLPALWPATQFYYLSTVLPLVAGRPVLAAALALPVPLMAPVVAMVLAARAIMETPRARRAAQLHPARPASAPGDPRP